MRSIEAVLNARISTLEERLKRLEGRLREKGREMAELKKKVGIRTVEEVEAEALKMFEEEGVTQAHTPLEREVQEKRRTMKLDDKIRHKEDGDRKEKVYSDGDRKESQHGDGITPDLSQQSVPTHPHMSHSYHPVADILDRLLIGSLLE